MDETSIMAVRALTTIENHIAACDRRYEEYRDRQEKTLRLLENLNTQMAEARGAGKMAKVIMGAVSGTMGLLGGLSSHFVVK